MKSQLLATLALMLHFIEPGTMTRGVTEKYLKYCMFKAYIWEAFASN